MQRLLVGVVAAALASGTGCGGKAERPFTIGLMPKLVSIPYFNAVHKGAREAANSLKIRLTASAAVLRFLSLMDGKKATD